MKTRLEKIREQVQSEHKVTVSDLSKKYNVTEETIRRDLEKLEHEGFLTRTFGGAVLNQPLYSVHYYKRQSIHYEEKRIIGQLASNVLADKRTFAVDASTTAMEVLKYLKDDRDYVVLSSSTEVFRELSGSKIKIFSTGGIFNEGTLSLQGNVAMENIKKYNVDVALISCKGLDIEKGIMDTSECEAELKVEMVNQAQEVMLLADHSKFAMTSFIQFLNWERVNYLVTDQKPDKNWIDFCEEKGIKLIF